MIDAIPGLEQYQVAREGSSSSNITEALLYQAQTARTLEQREKVKDEFFTMFYKEVLKQAFKPTSFGFSEENENSFVAAYASDLFVEQMARELAANQQLKMKAGVNGQEASR